MKVKKIIHRRTEPVQRESMQDKLLKALPSIVSRTENELKRWALSDVERAEFHQGLNKFIALERKLHLRGHVTFSISEFLRKDSVEYQAQLDALRVLHALTLARFFNMPLSAMERTFEMQGVRFPAVLRTIRAEFDRWNERSSPPAHEERAWYTLTPSFPKVAENTETA